MVWFLTLHKLSFARPRTVSHEGPAPSAFSMCTEQLECVAPHPCLWNRRPSRSVARFVDSPCRIPLFHVDDGSDHLPDWRPSGPASSAL